MILFFSLVLAQGLEDPRQTLATAEREESMVLAELDAMDQQLVAVEAEIANLAIEADEQERQRFAHEEELTRAQASLDARGESVGGLLRAVYHINRRGFARIIFGAEDPADLRRRTRYLLAILKASEGSVRSFREKVEFKKKALAQLEQDKAALAALQAELRLKESGFRDERGRRAALLDEIRHRKDLAWQAMSLRGRGTAELESGLSSSMSVASVSPASSIKKDQGRLPRPVNGPVMREFGPYTDPLTGESVPNNGVDIQATRHTPVRSVWSGTCIESKMFPGYGLTVIIDHGDDVKTVYANLGNSKVSPGQKVEKGQVVGTVGDTGTTDGLGPRLHFEVRYHDRAQPPQNWVPL